jgi:tRNA pseudouridine55 synthase
MKRPRFDAVDGVLLLDKPEGISSNAALQRARRALGADKAGHTGTLDPLASGLMALTFGEATKFSADLLEADKSYEARVALGVTTTTGDAEGDVLQRRPVEASRERFEQALRGLTGRIEQVPPMYSALKRQGQPLYALARQGIEVERAARTVQVHRLWVIEWKESEPRIGVDCSKGLYVRTLAEGIGRALGCGAHLGGLRRTRVGPFGLADAIGLDRLEATDQSARRSRLLAVDALLQSLPRVDLDLEASRQLGCGRPVTCEVQDALRARVYGPAGRLLGVASVDGGVLTARRLVNPARSLES